MLPRPAFANVSAQRYHFAKCSCISVGERPGVTNAPPRKTYMNFAMVQLLGSCQTAWAVAAMCGVRDVNQPSSLRFPRGLRRHVSECNDSVSERLRFFELQFHAARFNPLEE